MLPYYISNFWQLFFAFISRTFSGNRLNRVHFPLPNMFENSRDYQPRGNTFNNESKPIFIKWESHWTERIRKKRKRLHN